MFSSWSSKNVNDFFSCFGRQRITSRVWIRAIGAGNITACSSPVPGVEPEPHKITEHGVLILLLQCGQATSATDGLAKPASFSVTRSTVQRLEVIYKYIPWISDGIPPPLLKRFTTLLLSKSINSDVIGGGGVKIVTILDKGGQNLDFHGDVINERSLYTEK